jgi:hypothetical protein
MDTAILATLWNEMRAQAKREVDDAVRPLLEDLNERLLAIQATIDRAEKQLAELQA